MLYNILVLVNFWRKKKEMILTPASIDLYDDNGHTFKHVQVSKAVLDQLPTLGNLYSSNSFLPIFNVTY